MLSGRQAELRDVAAVCVPRDRKRRQRDPRQGEVDREHGDGHPRDRARDVLRRVACLLCEIRDGLDPRVRDHRDRNREREVRPGRRDAEVDVRAEAVRAEDQREPDSDQKQLRGEVDQREEDVESRSLLDPDDVDRDEDDDHDGAADDVPRIRPERRPEDRQVVRDEERRDGDRDDVVQHLRPRGEEADELVEGVAREARGAAGLREAHRPLRVGGGGRGEDQPRDDEDERRQAERNPRDEAERVVDRGADVAVGGREESVRTENAVELVGPPPPGHAGTLVPAVASAAAGTARRRGSRAARREGAA